MSVVEKTDGWGKAWALRGLFAAVLIVIAGVGGGLFFEQGKDEKGLPLPGIFPGNPSPEFWKENLVATAPAQN